MLHTLYIRWKDLAAETGLFTNTWEDADNLDFCTNLWRLSSFLLVADSQCVLEYCCQNLSGEPWSGHCSTCIYVLNKRCCRCSIPSSKNHCNKWTCRFLSWMEVLVFTSSDQLSEKKGAPATYPLKTYHQKEVWNTDSPNHFAHHISLMSTCPKFPHETTGHAFVVFPKALPLKVATSWTDPKNHPMDLWKPRADWSEQNLMSLCLGPAPFFHHPLADVHGGSQDLGPGKQNPM